MAQESMDAAKSVVRPQILFIDADPQLKASLQLLFTKLQVKSQYADALQAVGRLLTHPTQYQLLVWKCASRNRQNQRLLMQLSDLNKKQSLPILILCPPEMFQEIKTLGLKNLLPLPFKGMAFYQKIRSVIQGPSLIPEKYTTLLSAQEFFNNISSETLVMLVHLGNFKEFRTGDIIQREGSKSDELLLVLAGQVMVQLPKKNMHVLHEMGPGACFSEMALVDSVPRNTRLTAHNEVMLFCLPIAQLEKLDDSSQLEVYKEITHTMSHKITQLVNTWGAI